MKKFAKITVTVLSLILCLSLCFTAAGCNKKEGGNTGDDGQTLQKETFQGTHVLTAPDVADKWLIKDGKTDYVVVIPAEASTFAKTAKDEFVHLFAMATDITLKVVFDNEELPAGAKFVSIGKTAQFTANSNVNNETVYDPIKIGMYGVRIKTDGDNIYMLSGKDNGLLQCVYSFMRIYFDFDVYYRNCIQIDKGVKSANLKNFDVTDIPDIPYHVADNRHYSYNTPIGMDSAAGITDQDAKNHIYRMGYSNSRQEVYMPIWTEDGIARYDHNSIYYISDKIDYSQFSEDGTDYSGFWRSNAGEQICYTARGNSAAYEAMVKAFAYKIEQSLVRYPVAQFPNYQCVGLTQGDNDAFCSCDECLKQQAEDGDTPVGGIIRFCNRVSREIQDWMKKPGNEAYRRDDLKVMFFSYNKSLNAPVITKEDGSFELANPNCALDDGVCVYYAVQLNTTYTQSVYAPVNDEGRENFLKWDWMTDNIWLWTYGTYYRASIYFCDTFNYFNNDAYIFMANRGIQSLFNESQDYGDGATAWANLKDYINGKLAWDVNSDVEELMKKYFVAMYGAGADAMYDVFTNQRLYYATMLTDLGANIPSGLYGDYGTQENFGMNAFETWIGMFDKAIEAVEVYKETDYNRYLLCKDRIDLESVASLYALIQIYEDEIDVVTLDKYKNRLYDILVLYPELKYGAGNNNNLIDMFN